MSASASGPVRVERREEGFAIVWLGSEPVNSMTLELWTSMLNTLDELEKEPSTRGVIFASALKKDIFTAGNDIKELYAPMTSGERYRQFWHAQTTFLCRLLRSPLATVCAIRGACPAGGCAVALCCDYRVQTESGTFGLNEVALGIAVPKFWAQRFVAVANDSARADMTLQLGKLLSPPEAKALGLLDETVDSAEALIPAATRAVETFLSMPDGARAATKVSLRGEFSATWEAFIEDEAKGGWAMLSTPQVTASLGKVIERLSGNKKAKL